MAAVAMADDTIYEAQVMGVTQDVTETINRMLIGGWEHYLVMPGCVDGDRWMPVGATLFFRRPLGGVRKKPQQAQATGKGGGK